VAGEVAASDFPAAAGSREAAVVVAAVDIRVEAVVAIPAADRAVEVEITVTRRRTSR
jgi:hypothetical protein